MSTSRMLVFALLVAAIATSSGRGADPPSTTPAQPVVVKVESDSFHWQDAGLGAAAGLAATFLVLGLVLTARQDAATRHQGRQR